MLDWRKLWRSLFARLARWWKTLWQKLRGFPPSAGSDAPVGPPLSYTHYEFLFHELLEGVSTQGWGQAEIRDFFRQWQERTTEREWLGWLERFGERVLGSRAPNLELAERMVQLRAVYPEPLGQLAGEIGSALLQRPREPERVEEPEGGEEPEVKEPPLEVEKEPVNMPPPVSEKPPISRPPEQPVRRKERPKPAQKPPEPNPELPSLNSLSGVLRLLQLRPQMAQQLAKQMGIEESNPENVLQELQVRALMKSSVKQEQQGNLGGAIAYLDRAIDINSQSAIAWGMKGDLLFKSQRFEQAIAAYNRATTLNPDDEQTWYNRGMAAFELQQFELALSSFERSLDLQPNFYPAWKNKAISLLNLGRYQEALEVCHRTLEKEPNDPVLQTCRDKAQENLERENQP